MGYYKSCGWCQKNYWSRAGEDHNCAESRPETWKNTLTVKTLIDFLNKYPSNTPIRTYAKDNCGHDKEARCEIYPFVNSENRTLIHIQTVLNE